MNKRLILIMGVVRRQWRWLIAGAVLSVSVVIVNSLLMALSGWFIASMAVAGVAKLQFNYFIPAAAIRALAISRTVGRYIERLVTHSAAFRAVLELRVWLFARLAPLAPARLERYASGELAGRLRADIDSLENLYLRIFLPISTAAATALFSFLFLLFWSVSAAVAALAGFAAACLLLPYLTAIMAKRHAVQAAELSSALRTTVIDGVSGGAELILLKAVDRFIAEAASVSSRLLDCQRRLAGISGLSAAGMTLFAGLTSLLILLLAAGEVSRQALSGPQMVMLLLFVAAVFEGVFPLPVALQLLPSVDASTDRIIEIAESEPAVQDPEEPCSAPESFDICIKDLCFSYDGSSDVLDNFNFVISEGERVALAGRSGSGKSSVVELLLRFRDYRGSIKIGGVEIDRLEGDTVRGMITALPQQPHIFYATIRENILMANPLATEQDLAAAVHDAALDSWIESLPLGLDTMTGEGGSGVSGGEARRIAIARTLLKDAPLVILDEPTEGLDPETEKLLLARLDRRLQGKTVLLITHKAAPHAIADRIVNVESLQRRAG